MLTASVKIEWKGDRAGRNMLAAMLHGIQAGGNFLADRTRDNIDTPSPPASAPGEFPHLQSGELHDSIRVEMNRRKKTVEVTAAAEHAAIVESTRPYLRLTYLQNKSRLRRIVLDNAKTRYGHFRLAE